MGCARKYRSQSQKKNGADNINRQFLPYYGTSLIIWTRTHNICYFESLDFYLKDILIYIKKFMKRTSITLQLLLKMQ